MKAIILAAGLGTRLRPWTLHHPKALVPVGGEPMLGRVIKKLKENGFDNIVVNVHHFPEQIKEYLADNEFGVKITVSDESGKLLDTGGGILKASEWLGIDDEPFLIHNVDILSDADLGDLMECHKKNGNDVTMLVSDRESSRKLFFDNDGLLKGWVNKKDGSVKPEGIGISPEWKERAFSGIHVMSPSVFDKMKGYSESGSFPVMDFLLASLDVLRIGSRDQSGLKIIDIGKPATLSQANENF